MLRNRDVKSNHRSSFHHIKVNHININQAGDLIIIKTFDFTYNMYSVCSVYCKGKITTINAYQCLLQRIQGREVIKGRMDERYKKRKQRQKKGGGEGGEEINLVSYVHRGFVKWTFMWTGTGRECNNGSTARSL